MGKKITMLKRDNAGFTLIEVVVAMVLVSMISLIMAVALRLSLDAWERGNNEGEKAQIEVALPYLLERQLRLMVNSMPFSSSKQPIKLKFYSEGNIFSFYTSYSPLGTVNQGLIRVAYSYDEQEKVLSIYEKLIITEDDIEDKDDWFNDEDQDFGPSGKISGVNSFKLSFLPGSNNNNIKSNIDKIKIDSSLFEKSWSDSSSFPPSFVELTLSLNRQKTEKKWLFKVGGSI